MVELGREVPSWGLNRRGSAGLRFVPSDDEGFTLRGDNRRLVYKGRRRSHRFTILGDTAFEYDCILEREPESNVISLLMEGTENLDFFRQPDFVKDPFLKGSYAVYKKETLIGEGTGKLCHIHRPEIIDSRGRRCWGDLSVTGNELRITVPEAWLSEAKYPVIVDPTIGSSTAGARHSFYYVLDSEYEEWLEEWQNEGASAAKIAEYLEDFTAWPDELLFNRWINPEPLQGLCRVFFHVAEITYGSYNVFAPVLFNEARNIPDSRISSEEYGWLGTRGSSPLGWNMVTFKIQDTVTANSNIWLGKNSPGIGISFDYGAECFDITGHFNSVTAKTNITNGQHLGDLLKRVGEYIPDYREALEYGDEEWIEELRPSVSTRKHNVHPKRPEQYNFKFSYYFQPVSTAYSRRLTAGVSLTDTRKVSRGYKRTAVQTVGGTGILKRAPVFMRKAAEQLAAMTVISNRRNINRTMPDIAAVKSGMMRRWDSKRVISSGMTSRDYSACSVVWLRHLPEQETVTDRGRHIGRYIRGVYTAVGSMVETAHKAEYYRKQRDTVNGQGVTLRRLFIFIRLLTGAFVRDYIIGWFLKSREEIVIKSPVCRELTLESKVH
jgi:hypothetical protein